MGCCFGKSSTSKKRNSQQLQLATPKQIQQQMGGRVSHSNSYPEKVANSATHHQQTTKKNSSASNLVFQDALRKTPSTNAGNFGSSNSSGVNLAAENVMTAVVLKVSARFNMLDVYVHFRPQPLQYEVTSVQVRTTDDLNWIAADYKEAVAKFKLLTVELEPLTKYQIRCLLRVTNRQSQRATPVTTSAATAETGKSMELLVGYLAVRDFDRRVPNEVSFNFRRVVRVVRRDETVRQYDVLEESPESVESSETVPDQFALVRNWRTEEKGLAPIVCLEQNKTFNKPAVVSHQRYFYKTADKRRAAIMLMRPNIANGVFLMRPSADSSAENCIALSVRSGVENGVPSLAKFKIYYLEDGYGCFIYPSKTFEDIEALVSYYRINTIQKDVVLTDGFVPPDDPNNPPKIEDIKIPKSSLEYGEKLGNGKFGKVFRGRLKHLDVAIKELILMDCDDGGEALSADLILEEALVMAGLFHDNIVKLIAVSIDSPPFCLISEFMNIGSLKKYLSLPEKRQTIDFNTVLYILLQISSGMAYLEGKNFIHRDLRADNVLVHEEPGSSLEVKIADFGLSRIVPEGVYTSTSRLLPIRWTAPEALTNLKFSLKSDVWSFGILAFEVVSLGSVPYPSIKSNSQVQRSIQNGVIMSLAECQQTDSALCPESLYNLIKQCWALEPEKRVDFQTLKSAFERFEEAMEGQYLQ